MRTQLSKKTRFEVFKRDSFTCQYCGATPPRVVLHVDHIKPVAGGGGNEMDNLVTACDGCNLGKGATPLDSVPLPLKDKAALVAEREEQLRGYNEVMEAARARREDDAWRVAEIFMKASGYDSIHKSYLQTIREFVDKVGVHECLEAMQIAIARKPWGGTGAFKYFCGVCWNKVRNGSL